ncbi:MAG: ferrous iron transporter B [Clostridiales bacterium]|nr:ferrous iron transporter B [Clostridiales bacterium]
MGLTNSPLGGAGGGPLIDRQSPHDKVVALAGNPNVGKSTIFNSLTGMRQHTGNWPGKTVSLAQGVCRRMGRDFLLVDLPGTYSLDAHSAEEAVARDFILEHQSGVTVVVCDATCLERNLNLALQVISITARTVVCVNLMDEAKKKGISIDLTELSDLLGVPVVGTAAGRDVGLDSLMAQIAGVSDGSVPTVSGRFDPAMPTEDRVRLAERIAGAAVRFTREDYARRDRRLDHILTNRLTGIPIMLSLLLLVFWITITGANYPSQFLSEVLFGFQDTLTALFHALGAPAWLHGALVLGVYRVLAWVISVMLPPMAIFFPLFTLLEDFGYLPRIAFMMDHAFQKAHACGKQALTMCMGFGCNAVGVTGCRIIDSPRERLIAILTNNFVPCNGRFPLLISIISMFFVGAGGSSLAAALLLTCVILLGVALTFLMSRLLSATVLKGVPSSFTLELPPYRRPRVGQVIVRSVLDRTLFVLGRAVVVAAPAGLIIWACANVTVGDQSILLHCIGFLNPFARLLGMDGAILMAFLLGFPANEIVMPIILMTYLATGTLTDMGDLVALHALLKANGWTIVTAVCTLLFSLCHWPCSTTCLTIYKETKSLKWTLLSFALPSAAGMLLCCCAATVLRLLLPLL